MAEEGYSNSERTVRTLAMDGCSRSPEKREASPVPACSGLTCVDFLPEGEHVRFPTPTCASRRKDSSSVRISSTELDDELDLFLGGEDEEDLVDPNDVKADDLLLELDEMINS